MSTTMPEDVVKNRRRKWAPKVRTGCLTCKKRKKRCDEARPVCETCVQGKYICDGYDDGLSWGQNHKPLNASFRRNAARVDHHIGTHVTSSRCEAIPQDSAALQADSLLIFSNGALNASLSASDHKYPQFYVTSVAPVLGTTQQWRLFWETTVPALSWCDSSVYHAMVALSAVFESRATGVDHSVLIMRQVNSALRSAYSQHTCTCNILILCRLLASISQCTGDRKMAVNHLQHGWKILASAISDCQLDPNIMQLLAPTFLCASTERVSSLVSPLLADLHIQAQIECLETVRMEFLEMLSSISRSRFESGQKSFLVACWNVMTQASSSLMFLDTSNLMSDHNNFTVYEMEASLRKDQQLLNLSQLQQTATFTFQQLRLFMQCDNRNACSWPTLKESLKVLVENFVVQIAEIQPNFKTGPFWYDDGTTTCAIEEFFKSRGNTGQNDQHREHGDERRAYAGSPQPQRAYYLEFVCPYRSGLVPAFYNLQ